MTIIRRSEHLLDRAAMVAMRLMVASMKGSVTGPDARTPFAEMMPGLTLTPPVKKYMPAELLRSQIKARAIQRDGQPKDVIGAVFFLASPDADFMSGQTINVDGSAYML